MNDIQYKLKKDTEILFKIIFLNKNISISPYMVKNIYFENLHSQMWFNFKDVSTLE